MWSCRLNKIKSSNFDKSIANSTSLAEGLSNQTARKNEKTVLHSDFFIRIGQWQYFFELFLASIVLALLLALAEAQSWSQLDPTHVIKYVLYINWIVLVFIALLDQMKSVWQKMNAVTSTIAGFLLLQIIVVITTSSLNVLFYWGGNFSLQNLSWAVVFDQVVLHLGYGVLLGAFCLRYIYVRGEWLKQQKSELNARIQAMQARIHPHFLFNSLNSVVSLIGSDPDRAEQMLIDLSRLFRASFQELKLVTLKEEIQLCQHYLAIEKVRLGSRLQVDWSIQQPEQLNQVTIPLLTLQPLLENCIFHGVEKKRTDTKIVILVEILQNQVTIVITNPFIVDKMESRESHGIAVENVKQRLKAHFGYSVQFRNHAGNGIFTTVLQYQYK
ncbi:alginate biosynthesis protein [Acinetobacter sp. TGL-Y2]|uniref:sensor histidine kinase n=1 Tax=Acinetobacter sp. TGL-Y2 TaxID=1407071 RepID=UPI0007A66B3B|nr:histidine kinase [Acinetobacter sp. TGL-Y2]AMW77636.1 alginate biosynthesis protein [Acinetobacter sp. TGL-Y2]